MLGHKRAAKSPLLQKLIDKCMKEKKNNFVSSMDMLNEYKHAVELWTEELRRGPSSIYISSFITQNKGRHPPPPPP